MRAAIFASAPVIVILSLAVLIVVVPASAHRPAFTRTVARCPSSSRARRAVLVRATPQPSPPATAQVQQALDRDIDVLSFHPKVFVVNNLLSREECQAYIDRASDSARLCRSNAPSVSLDVSRLWPIPLLCLGAGLPPVIRLFEHSNEMMSPSIDSIVSAALPPIAIAALVTTALAFSITQYIRNQAISSSRTSEAVAFNTDSDASFIRTLLDRVSDPAVTGHPWTAFEAPVVTRYGTGAIFARHNDASPTKGSEWADLGGQRVVTVICYLNDCIEGGGTSFDRLGITVQPKAGSALVFLPADRETLIADDRTRHESLPAVEEKWIVQLFGRVGPRVPPPLGIPDSFRV